MTLLRPKTTTVALFALLLSRPALAAPEIQLAQATFQTGETIRVTTTDCAAQDGNGWVGINSPDDAPSAYGTYKGDWLYFRDQKDCTFEFAPRSLPGEYEVRVIPPSGDFIAARRTFTVVTGDGTASSIRLERDDYTTQEPIRVTTACPDDDSDWIAMFAAGKSSYSYGIQGEDWFTMKNARRAGSDCSFEFAPRTETGAYEVRQFKDSKYVPYEQLGFEIGETGVAPEPPAPTAARKGEEKTFQMSLAKTNFAVSEEIPVVVECHAKQYPASDPWIGIRKIAEPLHSHPQRSESGTAFRKDWFYLKNYAQPGGDCQFLFAGRAEPGQYEVRVFRTNEDCPCSDNLAGRLHFTVGDATTPGTPVETQIVLTEAASRHKKYDYVQATSSDCISMSEDQTRFTNTCDFPISVYFTRKIGYTDEPVQGETHVAPKSETTISFEPRGTIGWLACHESQTLCHRALECIETMDDAKGDVQGFVVAECSAFPKE